ncbi:hypothetical protein I4U23_023440 [Adineta vaga]|nr:hypothetical protein I4U23_023440 [Adineta vaga]
MSNDRKFYFKALTKDKIRSTAWHKHAFKYETVGEVTGRKVEITGYLPKIIPRKPLILPRRELPITRLTHSFEVNTNVTEKVLKLPPIPVSQSITTSKDLSFRSKLSNEAYNCLASSQLKLPQISNQDTISVTTLFDSDTDEPLSPNEPTPIRSPLRVNNNLKLVWFDSNIEQLQNDHRHLIGQFRRIFDQIKTFKKPHACIDFFRKATDQRIFLIVSHDFAHSIISYVHEISQLDSIYILDTNTSQKKQWINQYHKIKDIYGNINSIYQIIKTDIQNKRRESIVTTNSSIDLDSLDPSFMYTTLIKEILLTMTYDDNTIKEFTEFCRERYNDQSSKYSEIINELEDQYHKHSPIWWYTRDCFLFNLVNQAFRLLEIHVIIKVGFLIQHLEKQIDKLHQSSIKTCTYYRGQGLSHADFEQLEMMEGGLFCFNTFLSTTLDESVAVMYAESSQQNPDLTGIVFKITVSPTVLTSTRIASLSNESYYENEENEALFSMNSVFRIGKITEREDHLRQVELSLTSDNNSDLKNLTESVRREIQDMTGWDRLGKLFLRMGYFDQAEDIYDILINKSSEIDIEKHGHRYHMIGKTKQYKNKLDDAHYFFDKALEIYQQSPDSNHLHLATLFNDLGSIYYQKKEYPTALEFYLKAFDRQKNITPRNHSDLQITYGNLADAYKSMNKYSEALFFYLKQFKIHKKSHPVNHIYRAALYENIAEMYYNIEEYKHALKRLHQVSFIRQYRLIRDEIKIAKTFISISQVLETKCKYREAIKQCQNAYDILNKRDSINYPELAKICERMASLYNEIEDTSNALHSYQETLKYLEKSSNPNKSNLARIHSKIGQLFDKRGEHKRGHNSHTTACELERESSPQNNTHSQ